MRESFNEVIDAAVEKFRETRKLEDAMNVITEAVGNDVILLGEYEDAQRELKTRIEAILSNEDGIEPDEWERISRTSLLGSIGVEHTETAIDVTGVKSGAVVPLADETAS